MKRRDFLKGLAAAGVAAPVASGSAADVARPRAPGRAAAPRPVVPTPPSFTPTGFTLLLGLPDVTADSIAMHWALDVAERQGRDVWYIPDNVAEALPPLLPPELSMHRERWVDTECPGNAMESRQFAVSPRDTSGRILVVDEHWGWADRFAPLERMLWQTRRLPGLIVTRANHLGWSYEWPDAETDPEDDYDYAGSFLYDERGSVTTNLLVLGRHFDVPIVALCNLPGGDDPVDDRLLAESSIPADVLEGLAPLGNHFDRVFTCERTDHPKVIESAEPWQQNPDDFDRHHLGHGTEVLLTLEKDRGGAAIGSITLRYDRRSRRYAGFPA